MTSRRLSLEHNQHIPGTAAAAYAMVADVGRRSEWLRELKHVEGPGRPVVKGDRFEGQSSLLLHDFIGTSEVTTAEPGRALVEEVVLGARFTSEWTFEPAANGTTVTHRVDIDFPGGPLGGLERWVLRRRLAAMQRSSLRALADAVSREAS